MEVQRVKIEALQLFIVCIIYTINLPSAVLLGGASEGGETPPSS